MDKMRNLDTEQIDPHAGRKTTFGVTAIVLLTAAIIVIGAIIAIWGF